MAARIARDLWGIEIESAEHQRRLISDGIAKRYTARFDAERMARLRALVIQELDRRREEAGISGPPAAAVEKAEAEADREGPMEPHEWPLKRMRLNGAAQNRLKRAGIVTVGQVVALSDEELLEVPYVGESTVARIREFAAGHDLSPRSQPGAESRRDDDGVTQPEESPPKPKRVQTENVDPERVRAVTEGRHPDYEPTTKDEGEGSPGEEIEGRLRLDGEWGTAELTWRRDGDGHVGTVRLRIDGTVSPRAGDAVAEILMVDKYPLYRGQ